MHGARAFSQTPSIPDTQRMTTPLIEKPEDARRSEFSMIRHSRSNFDVESWEGSGQDLACDQGDPYFSQPSVI